MPGNYTGNPANPTVSAPCNLSEPVDGDAATGASVESPVQSNADFATQVMDRVEVLRFSQAVQRTSLATWANFAGSAGGFGSNSSCIAFAPALGTYGRLCVVGNNGAGTPVCQTSDDGGFTWTARASFATAMGANNPNAVMFAGGIFLACGAAGKIVTSADGITWTAQTSNAGANNLVSIAFASGIGSGYWAVSGAGTTVVTAPLAATTWTAQTTNLTAGVVQVAAIAGQFCAISNAASTTNNVSNSTNGTSWAASNGPAQPLNYCFSGNFNLGGTNAAASFFTIDSASNVWSSTSGSSWTNRNSAAGLGVTAVGGVMVGRNLMLLGNAATTMLTTRDGSTFVMRPHPANQNNFVGACVAWGGAMVYCTGTVAVWFGPAAGYP